jgi:hypothetical protein
MQVPPEQPMGPGGYPRPTGYGQPEKFSGDLIVGIILIVLNAIGVCLGGIAAAAGGVLAGGAKGLGEIKDPNTGRVISTGDAQAAGGLVLVAGIIILILSIVAIVGSVGIIKSARWGLMLTFVLGILGMILSVVSFNIIGIVIGLFEAVYCGLRLFGNVGPKAV